MGPNEAQATAPELQFHALSSSASDEEIQRVIILFRTVLLPHGSAVSASTQHTSLAAWRERLSNPRSRIMVFTRTPEDLSTGHRENPLGFFFCIPKTQPELGFETLHIWLAGVGEEARGMGIFPMLLERTVSYARDSGYEFVTVVTVPTIFERMWSILRGNGWVVVGERDSDVGRKVLLKFKV